MFTLVLSARFKLSCCRSLKDKRSVMKKALSHLRQEFSASAAEVGMQNSYQFGEIGVAIVTSDKTSALNLAEAVGNWFYDNADIESVTLEYEII